MKRNVKNTNISLQLCKFDNCFPRANNIQPFELDIANFTSIEFELKLCFLYIS